MPKKILLAEDSVTIQEVVQMTFGAEDFTVTAVDTVDEALARAKEMDPDLVVADLSMSPKNAYDLAKALREGGSVVPVLALHGSAASYDAAQGTAAGITDAIAKPFDSQAMIDKVVELTSAAVPKEARGPIESLAPPIGADIAIDAEAIVEPANPPAAQAKPPEAPKPPAPKPAEAPKPPAPKPVEAPKPPAPKPPAPKPIEAPKPPVPKPVEAPKSPAPKPPAPKPPAPKPAAEPASQREARAPQEITIEAEPPPPSAVHEPLPSFDMPLEAPAAAAAATVEVVTDRPIRPGATLLGMTPPAGLPTPPPGMPVPAAPPAVPVEPAGPVSVVTGADTSELRGEVQRLTARVAELEETVKRLATGGGQGPGVDPELQKDLLERVVWEVVPELAETLIREELERLVEKRGK